MLDRSVLAASNYNTWPEAFQGVCYAFLNVIRSVESADILTPGPVSYAPARIANPSFGSLGRLLARRSYSRLRGCMGRPRLSAMQTTCLEKDYDLFFFMCQFPIELSCLERIRNWRERSTRAVAFVVETWAQLLPETKAELRLLDQFDHVFFLNAAVLPEISKYTSAPSSFLATASDCLLATPYPHPPPRVIDVYSMGRRSPQVHEQLIKMTREDSSFFYVYDAWREGAPIDWAESRLLTANLIKRSKLFVAFDPKVAGKGLREHVLSTRYFEGAAGGAVMIGSVPECTEFREAFDWEDAVIEIPPDPQDLGAILSDLRRNPERLSRVSKTNAIQCLQRHDWAHRWDEILRVVGLQRSKMLDARFNELDRLARQAATASTETSAELVW